MDSSQLLLVCLVIAAVAILYSSVGHGGGTGYIAALTLFGFAATFIRPTALVLNILVASIGTFQFWRAGYFSWRLFWPFALLSVPAAYVGGYLHVPQLLLRVLLGTVLLFSAARLFEQQSDPPEVRRPSLATALAVGAAIGLLAGLTGTGGGFFLSAIVLLRKWGRARETAGITPAFILVNSMAGLMGYFISGQSIPALSAVLAAAAVSGGVVGSYLGSRKFPVRVLRLLLAVVLVIAGLKMILGT